MTQNYWRSTGKKIVTKMPAEYQADASAIDATSLCCPKCGCADLRVMRTKLNSIGTAMLRTRYCRNCGPDGPRLYTTELVKRVSPGQ